MNRPESHSKEKHVFFILPIGFGLAHYNGSQACRSLYCFKPMVLMEF